MKSDSLKAGCWIITAVFAMIFIYQVSHSRQILYSNPLFLFGSLIGSFFIPGIFWIAYYYDKKRTRSSNRRVVSNNSIENNTKTDSNIANETSIVYEAKVESKDNYEPKKTEAKEEIIVLNKDFENLQKKKQLLESALSEDLVTIDEYKIKLEKIEIEISNLTNQYREKELRQEAMLSIDAKVSKLNELKKQGLLTNEELEWKKSELLNEELKRIKNGVSIERNEVIGKDDATLQSAKDDKVLDADDKLNSHITDCFSKDILNELNVVEQEWLRGEINKIRSIVKKEDENVFLEIFIKYCEDYSKEQNVYWINGYYEEKYASKHSNLLKMILNREINFEKFSEVLTKFNKDEVKRQRFKNAFANCIQS